MIEQFQVSNKTETKFYNQSYNKVDGRLDGAVRGGTDEKAAKHADRLFVLIDTDGDGNLTEKEFLRVCLSNINFPSLTDRPY